MKKPIGYISYTHGLDGKVKIVPMVANNNFSEIINNKTAIYIKTVQKDESYKTIDLSIFAFTGKIFLCKIANVDNIDKAKAFTKKEIFIDVDDRDFIDAETLLNFDVYNQNNKHLGIVVDYGDYGAGMLIEVVDEKKNKKNKSNFYQCNKDVVLKVDNENKKIIIKTTETDE